MCVSLVGVAKHHSPRVPTPFIGVVLNTWFLGYRLPLLGCRRRVESASSMSERKEKMKYSTGNLGSTSFFGTIQYCWMIIAKIAWWLKSRTTASQKFHSPIKPVSNCGGGRFEKGSNDVSARHTSAARPGSFLCRTFSRAKRASIENGEGFSCFRNVH